MYNTKYFLTIFNNILSLFKKKYNIWQKNRLRLKKTGRRTEKLSF